MPTGDDGARDYQLHLVEEVRSGRLTRRQLVRRASVIGFSAPTIATLVAACGGGGGNAQSTTATTGGPVKRGGTARFGVIGPSATTDPVTMYSGGAYETVQMACEYLCFPRSDLTLQPKLATKWRPGKTPKEWTFTLRQGVSFHDGAPFTAHDVVATFDRLTDPHVGSSALSAFQGVLSKGNTEAVDAHTVRFHLDRPYADFPYLMSAFNYNAVILPKNYQIGDFVKGGVGTGPFLLKQYNTKVGAKFVRNPHYWEKGLPYLDGVDLRYYDENSPIALALQGGGIDIYPVMPYQGSQAVLKDPNITVFKSPSSEFRTLQMRTDTPPFDDKRVRQAVALSLNRPALNQALFQGTSQLGNDHGFAPVYPSSDGVVSRIPQRKQDYAQAKRLLSQAGHPNGVPVTLTGENDREDPQYAQLIQQMCKPAGIDVTLHLEDVGTYYGSGDNQPWLDVPFGLTVWSARGNPSPVMESAFFCKGIWNSAHWCNQAYQQAMTAFDSELDEQRRADFGAKAATLQHDEVPDIIGYWVTELRGARKNVHGLPVGPAEHIDPSAVWLS